MKKIIDISGDVYNRLTAISFHERRDLHSFWWCQCICGKVVSVRQNSLKSGLVKSCGCLRVETSGEANRKHNEANKTKEYYTWISLKQRCNNPKDNAYYRYGGRGIKVCDRWINSYENFLTDMGRAPSKKHSLDRRENNKGYSPDNCRWATDEEQMNNRRNNFRIKYKGINRTIPQWGKELGINAMTIRGRIKKGWSIEHALTTPIIKMRGRSREYVESLNE